ncbi:MAG: DUF1570 domain-containing protein [Fuerstiella sp.]|nr:DUF1570 domain-containing protein [Fuerstiella sp.]
MQLSQSNQRIQLSLVRFNRLAVAGICILVLFTLSQTVSAGERLVRIHCATDVYTGKILALSNACCTLMDRQGRLVELDVPKLKKVERLADRYKPASVATFRSELTREFGRRYEVSGTTHYLVCAPRGHAGRYADLFEQIYRDVEEFYRVRGFRIVKPDVPLVAIVFGTQKEFFRYCIRDEVPPSVGLQGYYSLVSNRVALFDTAGAFRSAAVDTRSGISAAIGFSGITGQTASTIVHETIHQVGYNIGIHTRLGETPLWMVEGMATVLEPSGMRDRRNHQTSSQRVNPERCDWFRNRYRPQRPSGSLAKLIASDSLFQRQALSAYSEAWALTFFLLENPARRRQLAAYLQKISQRGATKNYSAKHRLADFQSAFGDIARVEIEFIRYMDRLQAGSRN